MNRKPKLRMTNADYVAIAVSPVLIMALVGSLVFFLIEVLYVGQYQGRLNYVFALFVFASVLIGRISIEMGSERAAMFALPLALAMFLVLAKFVQHASPYSHVINLGLLGLVWWCTHKLTWDCTLIDDNQDASGEGLMQRMGVDEIGTDEEDTSVGNELLPSDAESKVKTPHTPGLWVLYFSLAALPLFGIGQKMIPIGDVGRRQYAFGLLTVYVGAGLSLLVTTSFLGLRRYLRQRRVKMPTPMAATWVVTGTALIVAVMLLAALIPRPHAEYAISQVPWQAHSPPDLPASRTSVGNDGTKDDNPDASKVTGKQTDPKAEATREGDKPTTATDEGEEQTSGEDSKSSSDSQQAENSEPSEPIKSSETPAKSEQPSSNEQQNSDEQTEQTPPVKPTDTPSKAAENTEQAAEPKSNSNPASNAFRSPTALLNTLSSLSSLTAAVKLLLYAIMALAIGVLAWRHRRRIASAIAEIVQMIREFLARFFGSKSAQPAAPDDKGIATHSGPPPRAFASFADPFASGQHRSLPPDELVRYTFEAFEAWARERGIPRSPDQTAGELIRQVAAQQPALRSDSRNLARLYNQAAYAAGSVTLAEVEELAPFWKLMQVAAQEKAGSASSLS